MNRIPLWTLATASVLTSLPALADEDLKALRAEIAQMKQTYEQRIAALENRLKEAESKPSPTAAPAGQVGAGSGFNPQISLILDGVYYRDNRKGAGPEMLEHIDGINHSHDHEGHGHGALERGFNLRETELAFSATVSPHFDATAMMTVSSEGDVELEEAYFDTRSLPYGLKVRGGKFLSGIGYLNAQHPHQWDFVDQNLPYRTLLGEHGLNDTGLRLTWLPQTGNWYTQLGAEFLQGKEQTFATGGEETPTGRADGLALAGTAAGSLGSAKAGPRLTTLFAKFGPDLGNNHALQFGAWYARSSQLQEVHDHTEENPGVACGAPGGICVNALEGKGKAWGLDAVYKYDAGGYGGQGNFKLVGEYLRLNKDLRIAFFEGGTALLGQKLRYAQDGVVVQGIYGFLPHWQAGVRYDATGMTNKFVGFGNTTNMNKSDRWTFALTRQIDHFSLLRLQASRANLWVEGAKEPVNQIFLQYQHSLGAHGAHSF
jgi:hypothetical protein